jgi:hyperosmotically inducible periplasmic protein
MRLRFLPLLMLAVFTALTFSTLQPTARAQQAAVSPRTEQRIQKEVRHELLLLPYLSVFDNLEYRVNDGTVTLMGQVVNPVNKDDAEKAVKGIEGVEKVDNRIEVLPPMPGDDRLRVELFRAIYGYPPLQKYAQGVVMPIRIIVKSGHATLEGVVDSQADKDAAGIRANGVPGVFSVTNNLKVAGKG